MTPPTSTDSNGRACVPCLIDGKPVLQPAEAGFPVVSALTGETLHYGQSATAEIAIRAVESAAEAFKTYKKTSVEDRRKFLLRAAELFGEKVAEGASRQVAETSCSEHWATWNIGFCVEFCQEFAGVLKQALTGELPPSRAGVPHLAMKEPVGPVLIIVPWNGAAVLGARGMAAALAAGCTVVIKASEMCPWTHTFLVETLIEAGFPAGTVNLIMADRSAAAEVTEAVISHPALRFVEFIGSEAVGRAVGVIAAKHLKPIMMETGDQSPAIILDDANLPQAADLCAKGALMLHGQLCFSTERIIVQSSVKDEFCRLLVGAFEANKHLTGSAVSRAFADKSKRLVDDALDRGAKLLYGDNKLTNPSSLGPTILIDVAPDSLISKGEAFAPTVLITTVETDPQAIVEANSRHGGLLASVFTKNQERGLNMAKELEFGQVNVNHMTLYVESGGPLAGWKGSGWGSHAGRHGIQAFLQDKSVMLFPFTQGM